MMRRPPLAWQGYPRIPGVGVGSYFSPTIPLIGRIEVVGDSSTISRMMDDPYSLKSEDELENNVEEIAVTSLLMLGYGGTAGLEQLLSEADNNNEFDTKRIPLFLDLEYAKQCGNNAFANKNYVSAMRYYTEVLQQSMYLKTDTYGGGQLALNKVDELFVTVHANLAQVLLNVGRHSDALEQCNEALKMPALYNKPALHKKVLHRLKLAGKQPSKDAKLAAEECRAQLSSLPPGKLYPTVYMCSTYYDVYTLIFHLHIAHQLS